MIIDNTNESEVQHNYHENRICMLVWFTTTRVTLGMFFVNRDKETVRYLWVHQAHELKDGVLPLHLMLLADSCHLQTNLLPARKKLGGLNYLSA